jgi:hypothetical protein
VIESITRTREDLSLTVYLNGTVKCRAVAARVTLESAEPEMLATDELNPILQKDREAFVKMITPIEDRRAVFDLLTEISAELISKKSEQPIQTAPLGDAEAEIAELNKRHAVLLGGSGGILRESTRVGGYHDIDIISQSHFRVNVAPRELRIGSRTVAVADLWLKSPARREYEGLCFVPGDEGPRGHYNLWKGFAVEPNANANCQRLLEHFHEIVCGGSDELNDWVIAWFAALVQKPREKYGTALAFIGQQGAGKTLPGQAVGYLFGPHYQLVADSRFIVGRFNSHLAGTLLLQADEGFWAGDRTAEGKLKDLITGAKHQIEFKGREPVTVDNYVRLLVTSNHDWVVPASMDQRRFAVLEVSSARANDHDYFDKIIEELKAGGYGALLHYLQNFDLTGIQLRVPPATSALFRQKIQSASPEELWWFDVLNEGKLPGHIGSDRSPITSLYAHYVEHLKNRGAIRRVSVETFGHFLRQMVPTVTRVRARVMRGDLPERPWCYQLPDLATSRETFEKIAGQEITWPVERDNPVRAEWE